MHSIRSNNHCSFNLYNDNNQILKYSCFCGKAFNLTELYYCNGCQQINCRYCITEEIDFHYCPNCIENLNSAEASVNGNKCKKCFECPVCFNTLTYSVIGSKDVNTVTSPPTAGVTSPTTTAATPTTGETYFLNCGFCKWNSLDLKDEFKFDMPSLKAKKESSIQQLQVNKSIEALNKEAAELTSLKDKKTINRIKLAQAMKHFLGPQSKHQKHNQRKNFNKVEDRWESTSMAHPVPHNHLVPTPPPGQTLLSEAAIAQRVQPITMTEADQMQQQRIDAREFETLDPLGDTVKYDDDITPFLRDQVTECDQVSSLDQRFKNIAHSSLSTSSIHPQRKHLITKRSKRCKRCDKLLVKSEISLTKTEFKRQHFAFTYVPRVQITRVLWIDNDIFEVFLQFTNPLHIPLFINFPMSIKGSFISTDDNSQPIDLCEHETYINGILDETDDLEKESIIQTLKQNENPRYIIDRKDNKLTMKFIGKVGIEEEQIAPKDNNNNEEITNLTIIHLTESLANLSTSTEIPKFNSQFKDIKFTITLEFSTSSLSTAPSTSSSTTTADKQQKTLLKLLFDIPSNKFENTLQQ